MSLLLDLFPWWGWLVVAAPFAFLALRWFGFNGAVVVLIAGLVAASKAKSFKAGEAAAASRQRAADDRARDIIHQKKEEIRSIPDTPAGKAERNERFSRWVK